ncbi:unnamed protein product [Bursaphelenchus okinawaensis]|uniref:Endonuclease/exonuclease/phosphatase domain-containing protein n=1 Tax=Bursaphelenchus okinawaensis TaxID=465554 RepID=A0A811L9L4_9BILA|nr:unnamed protein product [Bursaphelenchus okinawaensis]CAG9118872.1 unnamed protein product [Bursaphelenchus okinawaensis]
MDARSKARRFFESSDQPSSSPPAKRSKSTHYGNSSRSSERRSQSNRTEHRNAHVSTTRKEIVDPANQPLNEEHFEDAFAAFGDIDFSALQNLNDEGEDGLNDVVVVRKPITAEDRAKTMAKRCQTIDDDHDTIMLSDYSDPEDEVMIVNEVLPDGSVAPKNQIPIPEKEANWMSLSGPLILPKIPKAKFSNRLPDGGVAPKNQNPIPEKKAHWSLAPMNLPAIPKAKVPMNKGNNSPTKKANKFSQKDSNIPSSSTSTPRKSARLANKTQEPQKSAAASEPNQGKKGKSRNSSIVLVEESFESEAVVEANSSQKRMFHQHLSLAQTEVYKMDKKQKEENKKKKQKGNTKAAESNQSNVETAKKQKTKQNLAKSNQPSWSTASTVNVASTSVIPKLAFVSTDVTMGAVSAQASKTSLFVKSEVKSLSQEPMEVDNEDEVKGEGQVKGEVQVKEEGQVKNEVNVDEDIVVIDQIIKKELPSLPTRSKKLAKNKEVKWTSELVMVPKKPMNVFSPNTNGIVVTICTYNVLCETTRIRCSHLYRACDQKALKWSERWKKIEAFLTNSYSDVFCLQEVEDKHVIAYFRPFFERINYDYFYLPRRNGNPDGCLIAYNKKVYQQLNYQEICYNRGAEGFNKDNVGQLLSLRHIQSGLVFNVFNTHILFNMNRGDLKLGQLILMMSNVINNTISLRGSNFVGNFLCGDFNMDPKSPLYHFVREGNINVSSFTSPDVCVNKQKAPQVRDDKKRINIRPVAVGLDYDCSIRKAKGLANIKSTFTHPLKFLSAYSHVTLDGKPEISTRHLDYGCPDFIFYQTDKQCASNIETRIRLLRRIPLPSLSDIDSTVGPMPNHHFGSDHLPLRAEFFIF